MKALLSRFMLRAEALQLAFRCSQADARFDMNSPTTSELAIYEADKARLSQVRKELS